MFRFLPSVCVLALAASAWAGLPLPDRPAGAATGSAFAHRIEKLDPPAREQAIRAEVEQGNVPEFWRKFVAVRIAEGSNTAVLHVAPDYLAIGSDADYFLTPMAPATAQAIADRLHGILPTRKMVDAIYGAAEVKLTPVRIPPSPEMTTVPVFAQHDTAVRAQRVEVLATHPLGALVAGDKKDVVLTPQLASAPGKVAIYGWHQAVGQPIQPLYLGHTEKWVDYSHGIRLIARDLEVNGAATTVEAVLADPKLAPLLSDEGAFALPRYGEASAGSRGPAATLRSENLPLAPAPSLVKNANPDSTVRSLKPEARGEGAPASSYPGEEITELKFEPGVRVLLNAPAVPAPAKPVRLILYALPNGNTIEQTIGRRIKPGEDWHFDIQHIGAQTRWLREHVRDAELVVAYLECAEKAWPAWRKKNDPDGRRIDAIVKALCGRFTGRTVKLVLSGHSGGGSFIFGYLNAHEHVPDFVERITFLDSDYAYDANLQHDAKLAEWLQASPLHALCVLAYHDSIALLNGKTFVSEQGGTWGRSLAMHQDLARRFPFTEETEGVWRRLTALDGRVKFLLRENPEKGILHTRQVEWNGFIHAMLTGTPLENQGYTYAGPRVYEAYLSGP